MSTTETPPPHQPDASGPAGPPERRCPRCGSTLAPDQEWCLSCGAAAGTEVVEARGWRVPLYLGGGLTALAVIGVILAIVALSSQKEEVPQNAQATPAPSAVGTPGSPLPTVTPAPSVTADPSLSPTPAPTEDPSVTPSPAPTTDPGTGGGTGTGAPSSTFPGWTIGDGYTVIIESSKTLSGAETFAQSAQDAGETVGILESSDYSSLNGGCYVVFTGEYTSEAEAEDALDGVRANYSDAYVRQITPA